MHADQFGLYASPDNNFNRATLIKAKLVRTQPDVLKPVVTNLSGGVAMPGGIIFLLPLCSVIIWAILIFRLSNICNVARDKMVGVNYCYQVPCKNCRFFTNSPYLKCAVHPSIALTKQAVNCSDYWHQDRCC